ncbi:hypothetical protein Syun_025384 [Stephania yunnanensis]|uniref:Uncharacterized protein n=1 Tax=Stephania yunnanensis TaxID=152371 RepID=A0AAP0HUW8_9MAGN
MANEIHLGPDKLASIPCSSLMNVAIEQIVLQRGDGMLSKIEDMMSCAIHKLPPKFHL